MDLNTALDTFASYLDRCPAGYVMDVEKAHRKLLLVTRDSAAAGYAIQALNATEIFDGPYHPGVRTLARVARAIR